MLERRAYLQWIAALAVASPVWAQTKVGQRSGVTWPTEPVHLVVPFPAGGSSAILGKLLSRSFERTTGQPLRLQYLGGAGGLQGASFAAKAEVNGQHLFIGGSHLAAARALVEDDDFDLIEDLRPLVKVADVPQVLVVNPARLRSRTIMEWLVDMSRKSKQYRMGTAGVGSSSHIAAEIVRFQEDLRFEFVHFRGSGPALQDLLNGTVDTMIDGLISCLPHIRSGRLKALLVTGSERVSVLPDVPCAQEMGVHALQDCGTWHGMFAPSQLSSARAQAVEQVFRRVGADAQLQADLAALGIAWSGVYGDAFASFVQQDTSDWAQRLKGMGIGNFLQRDRAEGAA